MSRQDFEKPSARYGDYEQVHTLGSRFGQDLVGMPLLEAIHDDTRREVDSSATNFMLGLSHKLSRIFKGFSPDGFEAAAEAYRDGQVGLENRLDLLSPLLDYGSAYMHAKGGFLMFGQNYGVMPFENQIGPMRNCELYDSGIRLGRAGLWDIRCQMAFSHNALGVGNGRIEWAIRVYRPDGQLYSEQVAVESNVWAKTSTIVSSVVVPAPGFVVKAEIAWIHGSRQIYGGPRNNRLVVQHISNDVSLGGTGSEESYIPTRLSS